MALVKLLHRFTVSERPRSMIKFAIELAIEILSALIKNLHRRDVVSLALSPCAHHLCLFDRTRALLQLRLGRRRPDRMVVAHRDTPVTHAASRIGYGNFGERLFSLFILE